MRMACLLPLLLALLQVAHAIPPPFTKSDWTVPPGFNMQLYYDGESLTTAAVGKEFGPLPKARSIAISNNSFPYSPSKPVITYVSTKGATSKAIYALVDLRNRGKADYAFRIIEGLSLPPYGNGAKNNSAPNCIVHATGPTTKFVGGNTLLVADIEYFTVGGGRIWQFDDIDKYALSRTPYPSANAKLVRNDLPTDSWHGWRYCTIDKQHNLYLAIGSNANIANTTNNLPPTNGSEYNKAYDSIYSNPHPSFQMTPSSGVWEFASIYQLKYPWKGVSATDKTNGALIKYARGVRNSVGMVVVPGSDNSPTVNPKLWHTDNGRDDIGGPVMNPFTINAPDCELNYHNGTVGQHYGFPFCHTGPVNGQDYQPYRRLPGIGANIVDPETNPNETWWKCNGVGRAQFTQAVQAQGPHVAALGLDIVRPNSQQDKQNYPTGYNNGILVAQRGSWDRDILIGARVMFHGLSGTTVNKYEPFITGGVPNDKGAITGPETMSTYDRYNQVWRGRMVDVKQLPDGTMLVSDDEAGAVYRVTYCGFTPLWGGNSRYGVGRCGPVNHGVTADKVKAQPKTVAYAPSTAEGCQVNFNDETVSYRRCLEFDLNERGIMGHIAYNLRRVNTSLVVVDAAFVHHDYNETNNRGWTSICMPPGANGNSMAGAQCVIGQPNAYVTQATAPVVYKLGAGSAGLAGFSASTNWIAEGTTPKAALAGGAMAFKFSFNLPAAKSAVGFTGNASMMVALGDVNKDTGAMLQHWVITLMNITISANDIGVAPAANLPIVNIPLPNQPVYVKSCLGTNVASNAVSCQGCYDSSTTLASDWPNMPTTFFFKQPDATKLTIGMQSDVSKLTAAGTNGYGVLCVPKSAAMTGNDCLFLRKQSATSPTQAVNYIMDGYSGYEPVNATCTFNNIQSVDSSAVNALSGSFTVNYNGALRVRFGGGAYDGSAGNIEGMVKHATGKPPVFACISGTGAAVKITTYPTATAIDGFPCA